MTKGVRRSRSPAAVPVRKRRTAEVARSAILDAAERRLIAAGPAGIRLQEVAADVGGTVVIQTVELRQPR